MSDLARREEQVLLWEADLAAHEKTAATRERFLDLSEAAMLAHELELQEHSDQLQRREEEHC